MHSVNSINDDVDENEGKTQEVCKRKDRPVKEIDTNTLLFILKITNYLAMNIARINYSERRENFSSNMIHGTAVWS